MILSVLVQRHQNATGDEVWELVVRTTCLEAAQRLSYPIVKELNEDIELIEIINQE